MQNRYDEMTL